jgi:hypothetical protein
LDTRGKVLSPELERLRSALRRNGRTDNGGCALLMGADTGFTGVTDELPEEEVIGAVRSVPVHY